MSALADDTTPVAADEEETEHTVGEFDIAPGTKLNLPVEIADQNSALVLEFTVDGTAVTFGVTFADGKNAEDTLLESATSLFGPTEMQEGTIVVVFESVGTAAFFWESKAVFRKRNVKYSVTAYPSVLLPHP